MRIKGRNRDIQWEQKKIYRNKESDTKLAKNIIANLKLPKNSSSRDAYHGMQEREIMGESEKENPKGSDPYKKAAK